jgi:arginyl-tRNA synthetase
MNIFELYLDKIKSIIIELNKKGELLIPESFNGINAEIPPPKFDCDISTNVAMVLSKLNKKSPIDLANKYHQLLKIKIAIIENIIVVKPGFINIKFKPLFWSEFIQEIITNSSTYLELMKKKKNLII